MTDTHRQTGQKKYTHDLRFKGHKKLLQTCPVHVLDLDGGAEPRGERDDVDVVTLLAHRLYLLQINGVISSSSSLVVVVAMLVLVVHG